MNDDPVPAYTVRCCVGAFADARMSETAVAPATCQQTVAVLRPIHALTWDYIDPKDNEGWKVSDEPSASRVLKEVNG